MASCFKCAVDQATGAADPIGTCGDCSSLACFDHGTRLKAGREFKCVLCVTTDMIDLATGSIIHDTYDPPGGGDSGAVVAGPDDDGGGAGAEPSRTAHEEFESHLLTQRIADASAEHRAWASQAIEALLERTRAFGDDSQRPTMLAEIAVTSNERTRLAIEAAGLETIQTLASTDGLDYELLADAVGVANWAIGEKPGAEMSVERIDLVRDRRVRFLLRVESRYFARAVA